MNILILNASPKRDGRVSLLADAFASGARARHEVVTLHLSELAIRDCVSCGKCQSLGHCAIRDDIALVEGAILRADLIIFATPTHWANVSASLLRVFERLSGFLIGPARGFPKARAAKGKRAMILLTCGTPWPWSQLFGQTGGAIRSIREVCKYSGIRIVRKLIVPGTNGMDGVAEKLLQKARAIGESL